MGEEVVCQYSLNGNASEGKVWLESDSLILTGATRHIISFRDMTAIVVAEEQLALATPLGNLVLQVGTRAERWADKIRNPKSRIDKLDVKPESRVLVAGAIDPEFAEQVSNRLLPADEDPDEYDLIFLAVDSVEELSYLSVLQEGLASAGAIWLIVKKGPTAVVPEASVFAAANDNGLTAVKVVKFSETHTAHKLVIPVAQRASRKA